MTHQLRHRGKTFTELVQGMEARLELVEHCINQQSILLDAVLDILERDMGENTRLRNIILELITKRNT